MSLTSTSSDSEQVSLEDFLESCRAPTLLGDLDDDDEMDDDENVSFFVHKSDSIELRVEISIPKVSVDRRDRFSVIKVFLLNARLDF